MTKFVTNIKEAQMVALEKLHHHPQNARQGDVGALTAIIGERGFYGALIVQKSSMFVIKGNHTLKALRNLNYTEVPVLFADVDDAEALKFLLSDNRASDLASYDDSSYAALLQEIADADGPEVLEGLGWTGDDLDDFLNGLNAGDFENGANNDGDDGESDKAPKMSVPILIELTHGQHALWREAKTRVDETNDTAAFLALTNLEQFKKESK